MIVLNPALGFCTGGRGAGIIKEVSTTKPVNINTKMKVRFIIVTEFYPGYLIFTNRLGSE
jgi:hypothetical protein